MALSVGRIGSGRLSGGWDVPETRRPGGPSDLPGDAQHACRVGGDTRRMPFTRVTEVRHVMGMPVGIDVADDGGGVDVETAFRWLREVDATFSTYRDDSDISRLDAAS